MGALTREKGVLKLVHPGRYVEIHTQPITAAEVLKKNPRHSVTRTDVFECPWIVVKPEAVLVPGKVFLIVPNHTVYNLLKAKGHHWQPGSSGQMQSSERYVNQQGHTLSQLIRSDAGTTPKYQNHNQSQSSPISSDAGTTPKHQRCSFSLKGKGHHLQPCSRHMQPSENRVNQQSHTQSSPLKLYAGTTPKHQNHNQSLKHQLKNIYRNNVSSREEDFDEEPKENSKLEYCSPVIGNNKRTQQKLKRQLLEDSTTEIRFLHANENYYSSNKISTKLAKTEDLHLESECGTSKQVTTLKPCLRKPDSFRKFLHLRVDFDLPINDELQETRLSVCATEIADFLDW